MNLTDINYGTVTVSVELDLKSVAYLVGGIVVAGLILIGVSYLAKKN